MEALGPNWGWTLTDFTRGTPGNQERMAFVFDLRRVRPSGLAAELVVPIENETSLTEVKLEKQFARTPYAVSFESQGTTFTLVTLHVLWGENSQALLPEITEIAKWLRESCGSVASQWFDPGDKCGPSGTANCAAEWIKVTGSELACYPGDSGGPLYHNTTAYGTLQAGKYSGSQKGQCQWASFMRMDHFIALPLLAP